MRRKAKKKPPRPAPPPSTAEPKPPRSVKRRPLPKVGDPGRYVYHPRLRCPDCASPDWLKVYGTERHGDGVISQYTWCRLCGRSFIAVGE